MKINLTSPLLNLSNVARLAGYKPNVFINKLLQHGRASPFPPDELDRIQRLVAETLQR